MKKNISKLFVSLTLSVLLAANFSTTTYASSEIVNTVSKMDEIVSTVKDKADKAEKEKIAKEKEEKRRKNIEDLDSTKKLNNMYYYNQTEQPYRDYPYGTGSMGTIMYTGCGPTSMAMVLSTILGEEVNPIEMANLAISNHNIIGGNGGTDWNFFPAVSSKYGLSCRVTTDNNEAINALKNGAYVINSVNSSLGGYWTNNGHFIVLAGIKDNMIMVNDPASRDKSNSLHTFNQVFTPSKQMWIIEEK